MGVLLDKSENSVSAAELLHQETYYATSVHCSYYSCLQLMKDIVLYYCEDFDNDEDFDYQQKESKTPSHEFLINYINKKLNEKNMDFRKFNRSINELKRKRVEADYKEIVIMESVSKWAMEKSGEVNTELKTSFEV